MATTVNNNYGLPEGFKLGQPIQKKPNNYGLPEGFTLDEPTKEQPKGMMDRMGQDYADTMMKLQENKDKYKLVQQGVFPTASHAIGTALGGYGQMMAEPVVSAWNALPESETKPIEQAVMPVLQKGAEYANKLPESVKQYGSDALNIASVLPVGKMLSGAGNIAATGVESAAQKLGGKLINSAEKAAQAKKYEKASKAILPDVSTISGRKQAIEEGGVGVKKTLFGKGEAYAKPDKLQEQSIQELMNVEEFDPNALHIDNANAVNNAIVKEAETLKGVLEKENVSLLTNERTDLPKTVDAFGGVLNHQPINVPSANKFHDVLDKAVSAISSNETLSGNARATASRIASKMKEFVDANPQTTAGLLQARKDFDKWVKEARSGQKALEPDFENGLSAAARVVRDTTNDFISANTSSADVKASLAKQSALFRARDALEEKARKQAFTRGERAADAIDKYAHLKGVGAKGAGLLATGGAAYLAPQVTIPAISLYALGKGFTSNPVKKAVGKTLTFSSKERQLADIIKRSK